MSRFCTAKATHIFFQQKISTYLSDLDVNFNECLTNDVVSFEQLGPGGFGGSGFGSSSGRYIFCLSLVGRFLDESCTANTHDF